MTDKKKILRLTLSKKPFEVMLKGEKTEEFRNPSEWIKSRLFNKDGTRRDYDVVEFVNGYGKDKPAFTTIFNGFTTCKKLSERIYSGNFKVIINEGDIIIHLGDVISKRNIKKI